MIGRTIGKYRILGQLGRGGAGIVYKAVDGTLNREVAIKTLSPDLANTEVMKRFRAEATILARLNHPQIATIYELFRSDTDLLMVMEFVRGETLDRVSQRRGALPPDAAAYVIDQILSALEHAHRAGVVHRDMKPANVMVTERGGVKIMDFGIARVRGAEQMTIEGRCMGTPAYMPPEQVLGQEVDARADLYAVGVVFYRLIAGALPFAGETPLALLQQQIVETPMPLHRHRTDLPEWCEPIVRRALAKAPDDRFQTAEEFREAIGHATGLLAVADLAKAVAISPDKGDTLDLSSVEAVPGLTSSGGFERTTIFQRRTFAQAALIVAFVALSVGLVGYAALWATATGAVIPPPPPQPLADEQPAPTMAPAFVGTSAHRSGFVETPADKAALVETPAETAAVIETRAKGPSFPAVEPERAAASMPGAVAEPVVRAPAPRPSESETITPTAGGPRPMNTGFDGAEAPLVFETRVLVGTKKPREHEAKLVLARGKITVARDLETEYPFYSVPYGSVISISYSRGRDPMWDSPHGPTPVSRGGGTLGRLGIVVARDWISLRTSTQDQFVAMRFDNVLVRRVLLALEERTGRTAQVIAEPKETSQGLRP